MHKQSRAWRMAAAALLSLVVLGCEDDTERAVKAALKEAEAHQKAAHWCEARVALARAEGLLGKNGPEALRQRIEQMRKDAELVARLEQVRLSRVDVKDNVAARYARAFRDYGIDVATLEADEAARRVRESARRQELLAALDTWALARPAGEKRKALWAVADGADDSKWRKALRKTLASGDGKALVKLASEPEAARQSPAVLVLLGHALVQAGLPAEAEKLMRQGQWRHPADFWLNHNLGLLLARQPGGQAEALEYFRAALALRPDSPGVYLNLGSSLLEQGRLAEATQSFRRAIELQPGLAAAHTNLGAVLFREGKLDEAVACYRQAIRLDPKSAPPHRLLGLVLTRQDKLPEAIASFRKAIALDPAVASAHGALGVVLLRQGKRDEAVACFRQAIRLDPKSARAHNDLGLVLIQQRKLAEAADHFRRAIELQPRFTAAHSNLGATLSRQGKLAEAVACYRQAIRLDPKFATGHQNLGLVLAQAGKLDEAIACFRRTIALDPSSASAHFNLGQALRNKGDLEGAIASFRKALQLQPDLAAAKKALDAALKEKDKRETKE